jgi:hypothetical protein
MTSSLPQESLLALAKRLEAERRALVERLLSAAEGEALNLDLLRQLASLHGAWLAVMAEIEAHTPTLGRGSEI